MAMRYSLWVALSLLPAAASAQVDQRAVIQVAGVGRVSTPADLAQISYRVSGEGSTADAASAALAAKQKAVRQGLLAVLGRDAEVTSGDVTVSETRGAQCNDAGYGYGSRLRLSEGDCAVTGFVATSSGRVRTGAVTKAGTAVGMATRMGAGQARIETFALRDPAAARQRATAAALRDARERAAALASGAGVPLGALIQVNDGSAPFNEMTPFVATPVAAPPPPPPPPPSRSK